MRWERALFGVGIELRSPRRDCAGWRDKKWTQLISQSSCVPFLFPLKMTLWARKD